MCVWAALAACAELKGPPSQAAPSRDADLRSLRAVQELNAFAYSLLTGSSEFYVAYLRYPVSLKDIDDPSLPASVRAVQLDTKTGAIEIDLALRTLGGERIYLLRGGPAKLRWQCISPDIEAIGATLPGCRYIAGFVPPTESLPDTRMLASEAPEKLTQTPASAAAPAPPMKPLALEPPTPPPAPEASAKLPAPEPLRLEPNWNGLYEGTLGGLRIVAAFWQTEQTTSKLRDPHEPVGGRYYYRAHPKTMILRDTPNALLECPESTSVDDRCPHPTGIWKVEVKEDRVIGTWQASEDAPTKVIELKRRATGSRESSDVFYALQHDDKPRAVALAAKRHGIAWKTARRGSGYESRTGSIVLLQSRNRAARERINRWLAEHIKWPDTQKECEEEHPESCDEGWDVDVLFANARLFAIGGSSYISGGAHPSSGFDAHTFDLQTGREIDWKDVVRINDASARRETPLDLRRRDLLATHVLRAAMADNEGCLYGVVEYYGCAGDSCARGPELEYLPWSIYPMSEGLAVAPDVYPEAGRGCRGETVTIPWERVRETLVKPIVLP